MYMHIMERYGIPVTVCRGQERWAVKAFFQPVRSKSWDYSESNYSPLGEIPRGRYLYIGPTEPETQAGDTLRVGEKTYLVRRSELICDHRGPAYCWGLCLEKGGEDDWGRQS